jgi:alpha-ribazole phosphatase
MRLWLVRHTAVEGAVGRCYGRTELPLASTFSREAIGIRLALPAGLRVIYSSPAKRCRVLAEWLGGDLRLEPRLQELDFGAWEGRLWSEIAREESDEWAADFVNRAPPGGESFAALAERASAWADEMKRRQVDGTVVAVTHAGVIRALAARAAGRDLKEAFALAVPIGAVVELEWP